MPHSRRYFKSKQPYMISFRTREGLPLVCTEYMKLILGGVVARTQRDYKFTLCHEVWMNNHPHLFGVCDDPHRLTEFYAEVQKKTTDSIKALLGLHSLRLWEGRAVVAQVLDVESAIEQIAYLYANPARANLVATIEEYPGRNSFQRCAYAPPTLDATVETTELWVPPSKIMLLPSVSMHSHKDHEFTDKLRAIGVPQKLLHQPNAWMQCFGITRSAQIAEVQRLIIERVRANEKQHAERRIVDKKPLLGARALRVQAITVSHTPPSTERRVYVITSDNQRRISFIQTFKALCNHCRELFQRALQGLHCEWPPGIFRPPLRHVASLLT